MGPHALVAYSDDWPCKGKLARLAPTNSGAVDGFLRTPLGMLYVQTKGQVLAAGRVSKAYADAEVC